MSLEINVSNHISQQVVSDRTSAKSFSCLDLHSQFFAYFHTQRLELIHYIEVSSPLHVVLKSIHNSESVRCKLTIQSRERKPCKELYQVSLMIVVVTA